MTPFFGFNGLRYVDTHCHVDLFQNPAEVMRRAQRQSVAVIAVTNAPSVFLAMKRLAAPFPNVFPALGLHPELAMQREEELREIDALSREARFIGEIGLDGKVKGLSAQESQHRVFKRFMEVCTKDSRKILTIHSRGAAADVISMIGARFQGTAILHWFTGSGSQAQDALANGFFFSVNAAMVQSDRGSRLLRRIPKDRVLTESDGPFARREGRAATPEDVIAVVDHLASLWGVNHETARETILKNFERCLDAL